ncbi:hypothetical protein Avbf_17489 [Armadillidium vulgare]|nr:hypothetical protein Avbf_17489 [Armadillidium vulgare]
MLYQKFFGGTDGRGNELNRTNISGFSSHIDKCPCDECRIRTVNKGRRIFFNPTDKNPSYVDVAESIAVSNRILSSGRNETNDFNISYEMRNRELVIHPISRISHQFRNYRDENSPSQLSAKSNLPFEYCAGPSRTNNDCQGAFNKKIPASSMHFSPQSENQNSNSQRSLSHNDLHYQREPTEHNPVDSLQLCDQQSY